MSAFSFIPNDLIYHIWQIICVTKLDCILQGRRGRGQVQAAERDGTAPAVAAVGAGARGHQEAQADQGPGKDHLIGFGTKQVGKAPNIDLWRSYLGLNYTVRVNHCTMWAVITKVWKPCAHLLLCTGGNDHQGLNPTGIPVPFY